MDLSLIYPINATQLTKELADVQWLTNSCVTSPQAPRKIAGCNMS